MDSADETVTVLNPDMMETAHVKDKIKHAINEG
jgi:hypothetical protein